MKKALLYVGCGLVILLAFYGALELTLRLLGESHGTKAAQVVSPIVRSAAMGVGQQAKDSFFAYPNDQLERDGEQIGRKLYHLHKGLVKGGLDELKNDPRRDEIRQQAYEAGQEFSATYVKPFTRGLAEGSREALVDLDKTLQGQMRKLGDDSQGLWQAIAGIIDAVRRGQMLPPGAPRPMQPPSPPQYGPPPPGYPPDPAQGPPR